MRTKETFEGPKGIYEDLNKSLRDILVTYEGLWGPKGT